MYLIKTFAAYALAILSGFVLLGELSDIFKFDPASLRGDTATSLGRLAGTVLLLTVSVWSFSLSLWWIRKQKKPH